MKKIFHFQRGFSLIELILIMGLLSILFGISTISLLSVRNRTSINTTVSTFVNDLKSQQIKAMAGDTQGSASHNSYGVYVESDRYTLFRGITYSALAPDNFVITLSKELRFTNNLFPLSQIVFTSVSGELVDFAAGTNSVTIQNVNDNSTKTIEINRYGAITAIN